MQGLLFGCAVELTRAPRAAFQRRREQQRAGKWSKLLNTGSMSGSTSGGAFGAPSLHGRARMMADFLQIRAASSGL